MLGFDYEIESYDEYSIQLKIKFANPLSVSLGLKPDILAISFPEPSLFRS